MLKNIRNFSKTLSAKILMFIVIIPFVFWGMGDVFNSGNTNSLAKINNSQVSTQDLMEYINSLNVNQDIIKDRIDENILEEILSGLISDKLLDLEVESTQLAPSEGPENPDGMPAPSGPLDLSMAPGIANLGDATGGVAPHEPEAAPATDPLPSLDIGALSEKNVLSVNDTTVPIKVSNNVKAIDRMLSEIEKKEERDNVTELEKWQKEQQKDTSGEHAWIVSGNGSRSYHCTAIRLD